MHLHQDQDREPFRAAMAAAAALTRRRLLALLATLGLAVVLDREPLALAKKKKRKGKKRQQRGGKKRKGGRGGGYSPDGEERAFLDLINDYRRRHGAGELALQNQLGAAAEHHSQDMARKNYFSHRLANGDSAEKNIERHGYTGWKNVGENIAAGYETANKVMDAWQKSPEHDRNMRERNFTEIGIGRALAKNAKYDWYWTTTFGRR